MNVLIIEDTPADLKLASLVLKTNGHNVDGKTSAEQAMESIKTNKPEVILLDLNLPGMDGLALARQLKQDPQSRDIPIVAITAAPELFKQEDALEAGCDIYIVKPINTRILHEQIAQAILAKKRGDEKSENSCR